MAYSAAAEVKEALQIDAENETYDTEIEGCMFLLDYLSDPRPEFSLLLAHFNPNLVKSYAVPLKIG